MKAAYKILAVLIAAGMAGFACLFYAGSLASAPAPATIGNPPPDLPAEAVSFESGSGNRLAGWFIPGEPRHGGVLLMHGIRANRLEMLCRARMLHAKGFSVLLFDFQAHGESPGRYLTFGYLESATRGRPSISRGRSCLASASASWACRWEEPPPSSAKSRLKRTRWYSKPYLARSDEALDNRMAMQLGPLGPWLSPLLKCQVEPRLGFNPDFLKPAERVSKLHAPLLLIAGAEDRHASLGEMKRIFAAANDPKELWVVPDAPHADFHRFAPEEYERRVLGFLTPRLAN